MLDQYNRKINYMRISVTDRCNLHCRFCMPDGYTFLPEEKQLRYEEILKIVKAVVPLGIHNFRITGGEPLVRDGISEFIRDMKSIHGVERVSMTTNGVLLKTHSKQLKASGLDGINISLCSTDAAEYRYITGAQKKNRVMESILECAQSGIYTKINCVPLAGMNDDNMKDMALLAKDHNIDVRFIEMMPIGEGKKFGMISSDKILRQLEEVYGKAIREVHVKGNGPAEYYRFAGFQGNIGFISARTHTFCHQCNRVRITADGKLKLCLNYEDGMDLRELLEKNVSEAELTDAIRACIYQKPMKHNFNDKNRKNTDGQRIMAQIGG